MCGHLRIIRSPMANQNGSTQSSKENVSVLAFSFSLTMPEEWLQDSLVTTTTSGLHSAIGYIAPVDKLNGRDQEIFKERDRKLEKAHELREKKRLCAYNVQRDQLWCPLFPTDFIFLAINDDCAQVMRFARKQSGFILKSARVVQIFT